MKYKAISWAVIMLLAGCTAPPKVQYVAASCPVATLPPVPDETRFAVDSGQPALIIKAALVDLQNWKADALACRAVVNK